MESASAKAASGKVPALRYRTTNKPLTALRPWRLHVPRGSPFRCGTPQTDLIGIDHPCTPIPTLYIHIEEKDRVCAAARVS